MEEAEGGSGGQQALPPCLRFPWPPAPGAGCLGKSADFPLKGRLTFQSAEESFERRPDRSTPRGPAALSAALRCDIQTAPRPPQMPTSSRRGVGAPTAALRRRLRRGQGRGAVGQRATLLGRKLGAHSSQPFSQAKGGCSAPPARSAQRTTFFHSQTVTAHQREKLHEYLRNRLHG